MTQTSAFYNGFQVGDAQKYSAEFVHNILSHLYIGEGGYVAGSNLTTLQTSFNAGQTIDVTAGAAFIEGVYYKSDATETLSLEDNTSGYTRIDRVVVRVNWTTQTARLAVKRGVAATYPVIPSLQQDVGDIFEIPIAIIIIPNSFTGFGDEYILDDRDFLAQPLYDNRVKNIMPNSEFMSGNSNIPYCVPIPMWVGNHAANPVTISNIPRLPQVSRGRTMSVNYTAALSTLIELNQNAPSQQVTLSFPIRVNSGTVNFSLDGGATTLYKIPQTQSTLIVKARTTVSVAQSEIEPYFQGGTFYMGQMTLSFGMVAAPFVPQNETIILPARLPMAQRLFNVTSGDYDLIIGGNSAARGTRNLIVTHSLEDENSSTNDSVYASMIDEVDSTNGIDLLRLEIGRVANSVTHFQQGIIPTFFNQTTFPVHLEVPVASTLTQYVIDLVGVEV